MAQSDTPFETSVRDIINTVFKHKVKLLLVALAVFLGVAAYTFLVQELYQSEAKILVRPGRETLETDPTVTSPLAVLRSVESEVRSEASLLRNQELVRRTLLTLMEEHDLGDGFLDDMDVVVLEDGTLQAEVRRARGIMRGIMSGFNSLLVAVDILPERTPLQKAIQDMSDSLEVEVERNSQIITVTYDAPGPELAQYVLQVMMTLYYQDHIDTYGSQAGPEFFEGRLATTEAELELAENTLREFRTANGVISLQAQKEALLERINQLEGDTSNIGANVEGSQARLAALEEAIAGRRPVTEVSRVTRNVNPVRDNLQESLANLRVDLQGALARFPDDHREVVRLRKQNGEIEGIRSTCERNRNEITTGVNDTYKDLDLAIQQERAEFQAAQAAYRVLRNDLDNARARLDQLGDIEVELTTLEREVELAREEYADARDSLNRARKSVELDEAAVSNIETVQPPTLPTGTVFPNKPLNLGLGILLGLLAGLFVVFLIEYFDDRLSSREKVARKLGVPALAAISDQEYKACT
mgnify:CR=1 FL=1